MAQPAPAPRLGQGFRPADRPEPARRNHLRGRSHQGFEGDVIASALAGAASGCSRARSSTIARAAFCRWPGTTPTRWCSCRTSRTCLPTATASSRASRSWARTTAARSPTTAARRCACSAAFCPSASTIGRFTGRRRVEALGADHPQLRRAWQSEPERAAPLLRQGLRFLRSGRGRRRAGRHERGARGGRARLEVLLVEEFPILGGSLAYARFGAEPTRAQQEHGRLVAEIEASPNITVYTDAVCNGLFADNFLPVIRGNRMYKVRAAVSSPPARSSSRWCSATTTCPGSCSARARSA